MAIVRYGTLGTLPIKLTRKLQAVFDAYRHFIDAQSKLIPTKATTKASPKATSSVVSHKVAPRRHKTASNSHKAPSSLRKTASKSNKNASELNKNEAVLNENESILNENGAVLNENETKIHTQLADTHQLALCREENTLADSSNPSQIAEPHQLTLNSLATRVRNQELEQEQEQDSSFTPAATDETSKKEERGGLENCGVHTTFRQRASKPAAASNPQLEASGLLPQQTATSPTSSTPYATKMASPDDFTPPERKEVDAFWATEGLTSVAQEFFDYYVARDWRTRSGSRIVRWQLAARNWERIFLRDIAPKRQKAAQREAMQQREVERVAEIARQRARAHAEQQQRYARQQARACTYAEAKAAYERALLLTGGDEAAALEMLKQDGSRDGRG